MGKDFPSEPLKADAKNISPADYLDSGTARDAEPPKKSRSKEFVTFKSPKTDLTDDESIEKLEVASIWSLSPNDELQALAELTPTEENPSTLSEIRQAGLKFSLDAFDIKKFVLFHFIQEDIKVADLKWSLFCAACRSYRYNSVLRPFPPAFINRNYVCEIDKLREVTELAPPICVLFEQLRERETILSSSFVNLLYWVLIHHRNPKLKLVPKAHTKKVMALVKTSTAWCAKPNYVFQVIYDNRLPVEQRFSELACNYKTLFAYHGSRLDNFYSILTHGLQVSLNKTSAFGRGIYLSSELNVCLAYSPAGFGWGKSVLGDKLSIVALCEMINHPDVKYQDGTQDGFRKAFADGSENGPVPKKYFLVQNSDLVRVRYLMVYCHDDSIDSGLRPITFLGFVKKYKMVIFIIAYVALLLTVGLSNSTSFYRYYRRFLRKVGFRILGL